MKFKLPEFKISPATPDADVVKLEPDILFIVAETTAPSVTANAPVLITLPCSTSLFAVITPVVYNVPSPEIVPRLFVPLTVNEPVFAISPLFSNVVPTVVVFLFVYFVSLLTVNLS